MYSLYSIQLGLRTYIIKLLRNGAISMAMNTTLIGTGRGKCQKCLNHFYYCKEGSTGFYVKCAKVITLYPAYVVDNNLLTSVIFLIIAYSLESSKFQISINRMDCYDVLL